MSQFKFTEDHEWLRLEEDGTVTIGITDYAQEQLGDVVYVELPEVGNSVSAGDNAAVVESVKAAGEVKMALGGEIVGVNERLNDEPELVNSAAAGDGWFLKLRPENAAELNALMDEGAYKDFVAGL